jgi:hypothetical protein
MLSAAVLGLVLVRSAAFDFYTEKPYDPSVPKPEATLGYSIGDRHTNYRDQERVLQAIAEKAGKRVKVVEFGKSWEGRPLRLFIVSSPKNMARLEELRQRNSERAEGRSTKNDDPAFVWVNECIHGDETASFESAMPLIYNLAASRSKRFESMLEDAVVLVNPCYNPDGHERYVVYYNSLATGSAEPLSFEAFQPSTVYGRGNHYRFDMNRDRIAMSQAETRAEVAEFNRWHPQVYVDQHGQVETYFFPPNAMSQNANTDRERVNKWTDLFGRATAKAFDDRGWTYFVKDTFDLYYPGYLDSFTTLCGAIGMTHETDGGRVLARRRSDDTVLTMRDGAMKHFTSALAVIEAAAERRADLIQSFAAFKRKAVQGESAGKFRRVILMGDPRALARLAKQLRAMDVRAGVAQQSFRADAAHDYWSPKVEPIDVRAGALVIDMAQPNGALAKSLLEPGSDFEPEFVKAQLAKKSTAPEGEEYPGPDGAEFYDVTGWSLPYAHNLQAWWCEAAPTVSLAPIEALEPSSAPRGNSSVGFAIRYGDEDDILNVASALASGVRGSLTTKSMVVGGVSYPAGTFVFLAARNEPGFQAKLGPRAEPLTTSYPDSGRYGPGSESMVQLRKPKIGVVFGSGANLGDVGSLWYLMDQVFHLPFTPLSSNALNRDLRDYTCLVVPDGSSVAATQSVREWVSGGGASSRWAASRGRPAGSSTWTLRTRRLRRSPVPSSAPNSIPVRSSVTAIPLRPQGLSKSRYPSPVRRSTRRERKGAAWSPSAKTTSGPCC